MIKELITPCNKCKIKCCARLMVPITIFDARRIEWLINKRIREFADLMDYNKIKQNLFDSIFFLNKNKLEEKILVLKRIDEQCIFLNRDGRCSIWFSHPIACQCYPFYNFDEKTNKIEYVKNFLCPREWSEREKNSFDFIGIIKKFNYENREYNKIVRRWNAIYYKKTEKEFFEWLEKYNIEKYNI